jgi:hypothetical protein
LPFDFRFLAGSSRNSVVEAFRRAPAVGGGISPEKLDAVDEVLPAIS